MLLRSSDDDTKTMRLLLVEDDRMIGDSLRKVLRDEGHAVDWVYDARAANATLASERFDLVLLDLGLPNAQQWGGGLDVLRALRERRDTTPVIVLTARDTLGERVAGLDAGADPSKSPETDAAQDADDTATATPAESATPTVLDEQMKAMQKARDVEETLQKAKEAQDKAIDEASGG